jgi:hypothetical protein
MKKIIISCMALSFLLVACGKKEYTCECIVTDKIKSTGVVNVDTNSYVFKNTKKKATQDCDLIEAVNNGYSSGNDDYYSSSVTVCTLK